MVTPTAVGSDPGRALRARLGRALADRPRAAIAALAALAAFALVVLPSTVPPAAAAGGPARLLAHIAALPAVAAAALCVAEPWVGLVVWLAAMPLINVARASVDLGSFQVISTTPLIVALLVGTVLDARRRPRQAGGRWTLAVGAGVGAVVVLAIASTLAGGDIARSLSVAVHGVIEPALLVAIVVALRPTRRQLLALVVAGGLSAALAGVINITRMAGLAHSLADLPVQRAYLARLTYFNVGIFGEVLVMALPLLLGAWLLRRRLGSGRWATALLAGALAVAAVSLYLTYSKSAYIGLLAVLCLFALLILQTWRRRIVALGAIALLSVVLIPYPALIKGLSATAPPTSATVGSGLQVDTQGLERYLSWDISSAEGETSIRERLLATLAATRMALDHPLLGVGPGRFGPEYSGPYRDPAAVRTLDSAHNLLPNLAAEFGLPAAALVAAALLAAVLLAAYAWRKGDPLARVLGASLVTAIVGFGIVGTLFGVDLYRPYRLMDSDVLLAALLIGAAIALGRSVRAEPAAGIEPAS